MPTSRKEVLAAEGISRNYQGEPILDGISLSLYEGELVSILGTSGVGKTTLFHILSGLDQPDAGLVRIHGEDCTGVCGRVSYMQQKDLLLPFKTVLQNTAVPLLLRGIPQKEALAQASSYFSEFGLDGCQQKYPHQLSGGMRQRAAFLRAWLYNGDLMLLDEPFSALDAITKRAMHRWYLATRASHRPSALFVTHDLQEALLLSDRICILAGTPGRVARVIEIDRDGLDPFQFAETPACAALAQEILLCIHTPKIEC